LTLPNYQLADEVTHPLYGIIQRARALTGPCPEDGKFAANPAHPCPPPNEVWMAEASQMIDDLAAELEAVAYWVPQLVGEEELVRYRKWRSAREKSMRGA